MTNQLPEHSREGLNAPFDTMFGAEIRDWISKLPHRAGTSQFQSPDHPDVRNGLVGLALSGGGMRSATYSMGVTQALSRYGLLEKVDYISTVSGGGYFGSSMAALCAEELPYNIRDEDSDVHRFDMTREHFPYAFPRPFNSSVKSKEQVAPPVHDLESPATRHIREHSRLLIHRFSLLQAEMWSTISRYFFSTLLLWLLFFLPPLILLSLGSILIPESIWIRSDPFGLNGRESWLASNYWITTIPLWLLGMVMVLALIPWRDRVPGDRLADSRVDWIQKVLLLGMALTAAPTVFLLALWGVIFAFDSLIGLNIFGLDNVERVTQFVLGLLGVGGAAAAGVGGVRTVASPRVQSLAWTVLYALGGYIFLGISLIVGHYFLVFWLASGSLEQPDPPGFDVNWFWFSAVGFYAVGALVLTWFSGHRILNLLSLHRMYERRLTRAWIIGAKPGKEFAQDKNTPVGGGSWSRVWVRPDIKMKHLSGDGAKFPYHLICAALNIPGSTSPKLLDRKADSFVIAPAYSGSALTRWHQTQSMKEFAGMSLARATTISGAAVSPNMGSSTNTTLSVITTLFNLRLGWWVANPRTYSTKSAWRWLSSPPWFLYWKEMFGMASHRDQFVYLSDGGHFETIGVYELLRRRCKYIIVVDATGEPSGQTDLQFGAFAVPVRRARIDFGVEIDIDLRPLMRDGVTGLSKSHFAVGQIKYPQDAGHGKAGTEGDQTGTLVYIKSGLVDGPTTPDIINYVRQVNPDFPNDSTADQQFDQAQFESYRQLGFMAGQAVCSVSESGDGVAERFHELSQWYEELRE